MPRAGKGVEKKKVERGPLKGTVKFEKEALPLQFYSFISQICTEPPLHISHCAKCQRTQGEQKGVTRTPKAVT